MKLRVHARSVDWMISLPVFVLLLRGPLDPSFLPRMPFQEVPGLFSECSREIVSQLFLLSSLDSLTRLFFFGFSASVMFRYAEPSKEGMCPSRASSFPLTTN